MKLTSNTILTGLSAALCVAFTLAAAASAGGGDGDSPYNMPRSFNGGGGSGDDTGSDSEQQTQAMTGPARENPRGPKSTDGEATAADVEKKKELGKKTTYVPVTVMPGGAFSIANVFDVHAAKVEVVGAKLKNPSHTPGVFQGNAGSNGSAAAGAPTLGLTVGADQSAIAKHLALGFQAQGSFVLAAGNAKVKLVPAAATPTTFATVSLGSVAADGSFLPESMVVVTVQASGLDLSALVAQWSTASTAVGKTVQVELAGSGVSPTATARFAAGVAKPTISISTGP